MNDKNSIFHDIPPHAPREKLLAWIAAERFRDSVAAIAFAFADKVDWHSDFTRNMFFTTDQLRQIVGQTIRNERDRQRLNRANRRKGNSK